MFVVLDEGGQRLPGGGLLQPLQIGRQVLLEIELQDLDLRPVVVDLRDRPEAMSTRVRTGACRRRNGGKTARRFLEFFWVFFFLGGVFGVFWGFFFDFFRGFFHTCDNWSVSVRIFF